MQIGLGKALCTFFSFEEVKKGNPLRRVLQSLTKEWVGGGMYLDECRRSPGRKAASDRKASPLPE